MIKSKLLQLRQLKQQILNVQCNIKTLKKQNTESSFEYAKIKTLQLKELKQEFRQVEQDLHDLLDKEAKND